VRKALLPLAIAVSALWQAALGAKPHETMGWTLNQTGSYMGKQTMYISPFGFRMSSDNLSTIVRNSDESVFLCSAKKKKYCRMTYAIWSKQFHPQSGNAKTNAPDSRQIKKGKTGVVAGLKAVQYMFSNIENGKLRVTEEYWCADPSEIPPKCSKALSDLANFPVDFGTPLRLIKINANMSRVTALDTLSCKKGPLADSVFDYPQGYQQAKDQFSVLLDDSGL